MDSLPASPDESENMEPPPPARYRVVMLGDAGVGKTALVNQFMTSEYMHTYDASLGKLITLDGPAICPDDRGGVHRVSSYCYP